MPAVRRRFPRRAAHVAGAAATAILLVYSGIAPSRAHAIVIDFAPFPAGHVLQSADFPPGTTLVVSNDNPAHPDAALVFNSACTPATCTGDDDDLRTPGVGPGNTVPQGKVMIIAMA